MFSLWKKLPDIHQIIVDDVPIGAITLQRECHIISKEVRTVSTIMYDAFPAGHIINREHKTKEQILDIELHPGEEVVDIIKGILISNGNIEPSDNKLIQLIDIIITEVRILSTDTDSDTCISALVTFIVEVE